MASGKVDAVLTKANASTKKARNSECMTRSTKPNFCLMSNNVPPQNFSTGRLSKPMAFFGAIFAGLIVIIAGLAFQYLHAEPQDLNPARALSFVGSETCANCHTKEAHLWRDLQHKHAMAHATEETVKGDFADRSFDNFGVHSRFFREDGKFLVETDGPDGKLATFEIKYTFGIEPLQQYLVAFPDGRLRRLCRLPGYRG